MEDPDYQALYQQAPIAGISGDTSFELTFSCNVLPYYHSTQWNSGKTLALGALNSIIMQISDLDEGIRADLLLLINDKSFVKFNRWHLQERPTFELISEFSQIDILAMAKAWREVVSGYVTRHHNFYDKLEAIFLFQPESARLQQRQPPQQKMIDTQLFQVQPEALVPDADEDVKNDYLVRSSKFILQNYIDMREDELKNTKSQFNCFWASLFPAGRDATNKISAARKCLDLINGHQTSFTEKETKCFNNGRLKNIIENNPILKNAVDKAKKIIESPSLRCEI